MSIGTARIVFMYLSWDLWVGVLAGFHRDVIFIHVCFSPVLEITNRQSWLILGSSVFTDLEISVESLKSQGKVREI